MCLYRGRGRGEFSRLNASQKWLSVDLFMSGTHAATHFQFLCDHQETIEKELDESLDWRELPNRKSSSLRLYLKDADPTREDDWPDQIDWMAKTLTRFHEVFAALIHPLPH